MLVVNKCGHRARRPSVPGPPPRQDGPLGQPVIKSRALACAISQQGGWARRGLGGAELVHEADEHTQAPGDAIDREAFVVAVVEAREAEPPRHLTGENP